MVHSSEKYAEAKPFLKWAGGKSKLLPALTPLMPKSWNTYFEPFLGGGATFFALQPSSAFLSDANPDLINAYTQVRDNAGLVLDVLHSLKTKHSKEFYYQARAFFNAPRASGPVRAAYFIYLNKTCFNGLFRVNRQGAFNVPFGDRVRFEIDDQAILACSFALQTAQLDCTSADHMLTRAKKGDFVYLDPPYAPLSSTSNFTSYTAEGFDENAQVALASLCLDLHKRGVRFLLSNNNTPTVRQLYAPFFCEEISAFRSIASSGSKRSKATELAIRNYLL